MRISKPLPDENSPRQQLINGLRAMEERAEKRIWFPTVGKLERLALQLDQITVYKSLLRKYAELDHGKADGPTRDELDDAAEMAISGDVPRGEFLFDPKRRELGEIVGREPASPLLKPCFVVSWHRSAPGCTLEDVKKVRRLSRNVLTNSLLPVPGSANL